VVLPAAIWGEKDGTFTNSERRVSRVRQAAEPPGQARSDFDIFLALAERWDVRDELFPGWTGPADGFAEWRRVSAGRLCDYSGITYDRIDRAGGVQWPCPDEVPDGDPPVPLGGTERLYADWRFPTPSGRAQLRCVTPKPISERPRQRFPLLLNTGRTVEHWHTRTKTGRVEILDRLSPEAWIEVHPDDAERCTSTRATGAGGVRARADRPHPGADHPHGPRGRGVRPLPLRRACANRLTLNEFDPISREPNYKQCAVRLERPEAGGAR
jgi:assimilatory nitrate reductase catalytic subunit